MNYAIPGVKIKNALAPDGFAIINAADFDPAKDELFGDEPVAEPAKAEARPIITLAKANTKA